MSISQKYTKNLSGMWETHFHSDTDTMALSSADDSEELEYDATRVCYEVSSDMDSDETTTIVFFFILQRVLGRMRQM